MMGSGFKEMSLKKLRRNTVVCACRTYRIRGGDGGCPSPSTLNLSVIFYNEPVLLLLSGRKKY